MQEWPIDTKIMHTCARIQDWYDAHDGQIYVAFSGGLGSTVLMDITRKLYPDTPVVFCNTGQELRKIREFVKSVKNVTTIRPSHSYKWVLDNYGYPVVSKEVSKNISRYRNAKTETQRMLRLYGGFNANTGKIQKAGVIPKKWHYLIDAPFMISDVCCNILKKNPFLKYDKETGRSPMTGEMADDSNKRKTEYLKHGCNYFGKHHKSTPLGFWTGQDVLKYIILFDVKYSEAYGDIIYDITTDTFSTTGEKHTGCGGCMFGLQNEPEDNNRFTRMKHDDPKMYDIYINHYKQRSVLDYIGLKYGGETP